ncbi:hypothetical protein ScPMuIL_018175 [Solemya velum]
MTSFLSARLRSRSSNIPPLNVKGAKKRQKLSLRDKVVSVNDENMDISPGHDKGKKIRKNSENHSVYRGKENVNDFGQRRKEFPDTKKDGVLSKIPRKVKAFGKSDLQKAVLQKRPFHDKGTRASRSSFGDVFSPVPQTANDTLPMEVDHPSLVIRDYMIRIPPGVENIDANTYDIFHCPHYAQDIYHYLQTVERHCVIPEDYLEGSDVTSHARAVLVDWMIQVQMHLNVSQQSLHFTVKIIDRYLSLQKVSLSTLQLVGISALLIATKYIERFPPEIDNLCHLTDYTYGPKQVLSMEKIILKEMAFNVNLPDSICYMDRFIHVEKSNIREIELMARYILDLLLTEMHMVQTPASLLTAASIYVSRMLFGVDEAWSCGLAYYTRYAEADIRPVSCNILGILSKAPSSRHQGARGKFSSTSLFGAISRHAVLQTSHLFSKDFKL